MDLDFLIVGQGLAGSLLAWELLQRGCKILLLDPAQENASLVAAGLINPITGMRFVKSDGVDTFLPVAQNYYSTLETFLQQTFYIEKPMLRIFQSLQEQQNAHKRLNVPDYQRYLENSETTPDFHFPNSYGTILQKQTGYLLTRPLLTQLKNYFQSKNCYRTEVLHYQDIQLKPMLRWKDAFPKRIIFCEGHLATRNPWFSWLPFQTLKGEILTFKANHLLPDVILNYGNWLIPLANGQLKIGASFDRQNVNTLPTQAAKQALINQFTKLGLDLSEHSLLQHQAGIRPCTRDKQPFIGKHPEHPLWVFNGFGAKGSLQIPWFSRHFADVLLENQMLDKKCDIQRCIAVHCETSA